jgi:adenylate cyclase
MLDGEKRRSVRITVLLMTAVASLVTLSTGLVLFLSGQAAFRNTFELLHASAELIIERLEDDVRAHVAPADQIVGYVARLVARGDIDPADREQLVAAMKGAMAGAPQIAGVVLWDRDETELRIIRTPDDALTVTEGDPITDHGLLEAIERVKFTGKPTWRAPAFSRGATYVYVAGPLYQENTYWGVMVTGVTINELSSFVDTVGQQLGMTAFILYGDRFVLAHPDLKDADPNQLYTEEQPLLPIHTFEDSILHLFHSTKPVDDHKMENIVLRHIEVDGERHLAMSRSLQGLGDTPWHVGVYAPLESLDDQVRRLIGSMLAGLGVLGLAIVCAILLARYIARPIREIAAVSESVGRFELSNIEPLERSRIKELDDQAVAFNRMLDGLRWFETYVPKSLVSRLIAGRETSVPSGVMEVTVMFTDIIGFTAMT